MQALSKNDPKSIGPFTLVARLGAGGMGVVYLATRGTQSVALKVLNAATLDNPSARSRFKKEIQTLRQISSPFVAKVIDSQADDETAWLAVEFINGPDLKAHVEDRGPLPLDQWITLAHGLLSGLQAIHAEGVIHRDIKPGNILISETGPKIIDFGISQDLDATSLTTTGLMAGSPAWLSPEQIDGAKLTSATDLFSAGSVLHFAASGTSPWGNQNTSTTSVVFNNILSKAPNTSKIPEPQRGLIEALLEKEAKLRPTAPKALKLLESFGESATKAQIVSSVKKTQPKIPATVTSTRKGKPPVREKSIKKAFAGSAVGLLLGAIILYAPSLLNPPREFVCVETSYAAGDLSNASHSTLEDTIFPNVISRDCKPYSNLGNELTYEQCHVRDPMVVSTYAESFESSIRSEDRSRSTSVPFVQSVQRDAVARFGCRSFVDLGIMTEEDSRLGAIGLSFETEVPFVAEDGPMTFGESRYRLMFDGSSGTFISRFYPTNERDDSITLTQSEFGKIEVDRIEYKSGRLLDETETEHTSNLWRLNPSEARAEIIFCFVEEWTNSLLDTGRIPTLDIRQAGAWVTAGEVKWGDANCEGNTEGVVGVISDTALLSMETNDTCNLVRFDIPEVPEAGRDVYEYCLYIKES